MIATVLQIYNALECPVNVRHLRSNRLRGYPKALKRVTTFNTIIVQDQTAGRWQKHISQKFCNTDPAEVSWPQRIFRWNVFNIEDS
jgi:hypothetical protein